jgi:hypothetical protein
LRVKPSVKKKSVLGLKFLENALANNKITIYLDSAGGLKDEWGRTCGVETIGQLLTKWNDLSAIKFCSPCSTISPRSLKQVLKDHAFNDTCDKLIVRIGITVIRDQSVVRFLIATNDSDFWHPLDSTRLGDPHAPVAAALASNNLHVKLLREFFEALA